MIRIRNSMLNDFEEMCPLAFKARWFGTEEEKALMDIGNRDTIIWGSYFEQLALGSGVGGKIVTLSQAKETSILKERCHRQAKQARKFLFTELYHEGQKVPLMRAQMQVQCDLEIDGVMIPVEGNIDAAFGWTYPIINVDTKYTGNTTNTWGKYAWGKPETMDMGQLIMYSEISNVLFNYMPRSMYYVADSTPAERVEAIEPIFADESRYLYKQRVKHAHEKITYNVRWNVWIPTPEYNKCKQCPLINTCASAIKTPQIKIIYK